MFVSNPVRDERQKRPHAKSASNKCSCQIPFVTKGKSVRADAPCGRFCLSSRTGFDTNCASTGFDIFIGKAVFICLVGSVNLVQKFQGTCFSRRMDPQNLLNLVHKSKKFTDLRRRIPARPTTNCQAWLAFRRFQAAVRELQPFHSGRRGRRAIFPGID